MTERNDRAAHDILLDTAARRARMPGSNRRSSSDATVWLIVVGGSLGVVAAVGICAVIWMRYG